VGELLRRGEKILGFGPFVYRSGDPRAVVLLGLVRCAAPRRGPDNSRSPARPAGSPRPRGLRRRRSATSPRCLRRPPAIIGPWCRGCLLPIR